MSLVKNVKDYSKLDNKIVLLKNADPGYDFIFSRKLKRFDNMLWRCKFICQLDV